MAEVVVFGVVAADIVLRVQRIPGPGDHVNAEALGWRIGGSSANVACGLSMAGHHVRLVGPVGTDAMGVSDAMAAKIRNALALYRPLRQVVGVEFRLHRTVLYNSIYRADDQVLVNTHVFGLAAAQAPAWHLRKLPGGELASLYIDSFERVWETATPVDGG